MPAHQHHSLIQPFLLPLPTRMWLPIAKHNGHVSGLDEEIFLVEKGLKKGLKMIHNVNVLNINNSISTTSNWVFTI